MIKKLLVCGKQVYFATKPPDPHFEQGRVIQLEMPVEDFWQASDFIRHAEYLQAANEPISETLAQYRKVFRICARHAVSESDRTWLQEKANE